MTSVTEGLRQMVAALPRGGLLDEATFERRHRMLLVLLLAHIPVLFAVALVTSHTVPHTAAELIPLLGAAAVGQWARRRWVRSSAVTLGLVGSASVLIHVTGGLIEAHFHFFVVLAFIALYQEWRTYGI